MISPKVSVVIPAYNAEAMIGGALEAVIGQGYSGEIEIIVVDDGSKDGTALKVRSYPKVRYVHQENAGPASARNRGANEATGNFIFFTDSDCRPEKGWIQKMLVGFSSDEIGVVAGSYGIANPSSRLARGIHGEIMFRHHYLMPERPRSFGSYNFAVRRDVFEKVGGFNVNYRRASGEDNDLSYRVLKADYTIRFLKDAVVDHCHQEDLGRYLKEQFRHGFWRVRMYLDHPQMVGGDDYTFWKDMVEVPLVVAHAFFLPFAFLWISLVVGFFLFELAWGLVMARKLVDGCYWGSIMWLRSFARTAGLFYGAFYFFIYHLRRCKKS